MKKRVITILFIIILHLMSLNGCMRFALNLSTSLFPNLAASFFEECDQELAKSSMPANLKILEGLLKSDPENKEILKMLSMGFCGYSMLFVEDDKPERASELYLRARDYGLKALGYKSDTPQDIKHESVQSLFQKTGKEGLEALLWTAISWNAWINLNLDKPSALGQLGLSQACMERLMEVDAHYRHGLPCILMGASLSARPSMFGGDPGKAKDYFERALNLSNGKFFLVQYYFAKYYTTMVQDRDMFNSLLEEIINGDPAELKDVCLINTVIYDKAKDLKEMGEDLFL
ncbi:TRAP transporter TatT component family protein [Deltaproteobacteria bacterium]|nr:TRAP transporter TatT component family protein [Deltaproteobacteria bacterium]